MTEVLKFWRSEENLDELVTEKLVIQKNRGRFVGVSSVYDYMYRPKIYEDVTLYEWIQMSVRFKAPKKHDTSISNNE